jgi:dihydrofolate reductase
MEIVTRFSISADGYVTTPEGWPALLSDPGYVGGQSHGFPEFQRGCNAVLMGHTTFSPALDADRWPWPDLDVYVLGSNVTTTGAPVPIVTDNDPTALLERIRQAGYSRDVHLVGGARTIETFRSIGALDKLGLLVLPVMIGSGGRLSPPLSTAAKLTLVDQRALPEGAVEITYTCT